jgi:hypothetical protein
LRFGTCVMRTSVDPELKSEPVEIDTWARAHRGGAGLEARQASRSVRPLAPCHAVADRVKCRPDRSNASARCSGLTGRGYDLPSRRRRQGVRLAIHLFPRILAKQLERGHQRWPTLFETTNEPAAGGPPACD